MTIKKPLETIREEADVYQLAEGKTIRLSEMRCKDYYSLFQVKLGSITSCCSGNEPTLTPEKTAGRV